MVFGFAGCFANSGWSPFGTTVFARTKLWIWEIFINLSCPHYDCSNCTVHTAHPLDDGSILRLMHTQKTIKAHPNQSLSSQLHALATPNKSHLRTKVIANIFQQRNYKANALDLRSSSRNKLMLHALRWNLGDSLAIFSVYFDIFTH